MQNTARFTKDNFEIANASDMKKLLDVVEGSGMFVPQRNVAAGLFDWNDDVLDTLVSVLEHDETLSYVGLDANTVLDMVVLKPTVCVVDADTAESVATSCGYSDMSGFLYNCFTGPMRLDGAFIAARAVGGDVVIFSTSFSNLGNFDKALGIA